MLADSKTDKIISFNCEQYDHLSIETQHIHYSILNYLLLSYSSAKTVLE